MSVVTIRSAALVGVDAQPIDVEVSLLNTIPGLKTVGLPDSALREGRERIVSALRNSGLVQSRPAALINLAPGELRKTGTAYELPIAVGILATLEKIALDALAGLLFVGELGLKGEVRGVRGALAMASLARSLGARGIVVPRINAEEAALVEGIRVLAVENLRELVAGLTDPAGLAVFEPQPRPADGGSRNAEDPKLDLADVRGQAEARRAAEIAAAGGHNLLLIGPPGGGKTMIARRLATILPPLTREEAIETTRVHSAAGLLLRAGGLVERRPFRAPHHTISSAGLVGGYFPPRPGEVSLAHNGVLFLDELAEYPRGSLEALREPIEEGRIRVVRGGLSAQFPARTVLVAATNPCPCGFRGDPVRDCSCPPGAVLTYQRRLSGPLLDRIDLQVEVGRLTVEELSCATPGEPTRVVAERVRRARRVQEKRGARVGAFCNASLPERSLRDLVPLPPEAQAPLERAVNRLGLSPRGYARVLRVSRTIADLEGAARVSPAHLLEALSYRGLERGMGA